MGSICLQNRHGCASFFSSWGAISTSFRCLRGVAEALGGAGGTGVTCVEPSRSSPCHAPTPRNGVTKMHVRTQCGFWQTFVMVETTPVAIVQLSLPQVTSEWVTKNFVVIRIEVFRLRERIRRIRHAVTIKLQNRRDVWKFVVSMIVTRGYMFPFGTHRIFFTGSVGLKVPHDLNTAFTCMYLSAHKCFIFVISAILFSVADRKLSSVHI